MYISTCMHYYIGDPGYPGSPGHIGPPGERGQKGKLDVHSTGVITAFRSKRRYRRCWR